jgi:hypothetical protein
VASVWRGISIDPGMSSGLCEFEWGETSPFQIVRSWQFSGGAPMLARVLNNAVAIDLHAYDAIVVEKFTPRANSGFALTRKSAEPLRGEGVLYGLGVTDEDIHWREPSQQYFMGGTNLTERKKRSRDFLKKHNIYPSGAAMGQSDADDAISAELHAIGWLRSIRHMPTLERFFN